MLGGLSHCDSFPGKDPSELLYLQGTASSGARLVELFLCAFPSLVEEARKQTEKPLGCSGRGQVTKFCFVK